MGEDEGMERFKINGKLHCNVVGRRIMLWRTLGNQQAKSFALSTEEIQAIAELVHIQVRLDAVSEVNPFKEQLDVLQGSYDVLKQEYESATKKISESVNQAAKDKSMISRLNEQIEEMRDKRIAVTDKRHTKDDDVISADAMIGSSATVKKEEVVDPSKFNWDALNLEYLTMKNLTYRRYDWDGKAFDKYVSDLNEMTGRFVKANKAFDMNDAFAEIEELNVIQEGYDWRMLNRAYQCLVTYLNNHIFSPETFQDDERNTFLERYENTIEQYLEENGALNMEPIVGKMGEGN